MDEGFRERGDDRVAVGAQASHAAGSPMSQRECAGFNWPPTVVAAVDPVSTSPVTVSRAGVARSGSPAVRRLLSVLPAALLPFCAGVPAIGVGHEDRCTATFASPICGSVGRLPSIIGGVDFASTRVAFGVGQLARRATSFNGRALSPCLFEADDFQSRAVAVGHAESAAVVTRSWPFFDNPPPLVPSVAFAVGHEVQPLSDVRRTDARSAEIERPNGVVRGFQVRVNKVEPTEAILARNLLSKDDWRSALADEVEPRGPQMPLVSKPIAFACRAERLAGARACPNWAIVRPPSAA